MKAFLLLVVLIVTCSIAQAQTYSSSCTPSDSMEIIYRNDACKLAIQRLRETNSPLIDSVSIPEVLVDSIEKALYEVTNMQNALVVDTLKEIFGYSTFYPGSDSSHIVSAGRHLGPIFIKEISVTFTNNSIAGTEWLAGNYNTTSNDTLNYLMSNHQLSVRLNNFQQYPDRTAYIVSSPIAINTEALAKKFMSFSGVYSAGTQSAFFSGNVIEAIFEQGHIKLLYSFGCGDCVMGCTIRRNWNFKVFTETDCSVNYVSVENWGLPIMWFTSPCIDNIMPVELCPGDSSAIRLYAYRLTDTLQWQVSTDGINYSDINDDNHYMGTDSGTLYLNNIPSAWYGYTYTCLQNGNRGKIYYTLKFTNQWNGTVDSNWENAANWSCESLPDSFTDVTIRSGTVFLNTDATVRSLTVNPGASLIIAPGINLTVLH